MQRSLVSILLGLSASGPATSVNVVEEEKTKLNVQTVVVS